MLIGGSLILTGVICLIANITKREINKMIEGQEEQDRSEIEMR